MDNFDLRKFLAEGKLHEAMSPQDVVDIADTVAEEFTKESADEGDFLIYTVGRMEADDMSFELDTDVSAQTPKDLDTRGVGEGWGGIFRIKPTANGYQVRNAEKGGLVAIIDNTGNFKMLSADEARAEMGRTKGEKTDYMERRREMSDYIEEGETLNEGLFDTVKDKLLAAKDKIMSKVSPEAIKMFKSKVEQALGKPASELGMEDLTLANAKKVGALVKDQLTEEETLNEGLKDTIGGILGVLGLATSIVGMGIGMGPWIAVAGLIMLAISWMTSLEESVNEAKEEAPKSNKMKKSELKEMIRTAMLAETSVKETLVDADQDMAEAILNALGGEAAFEAVVRAMSTDDAQTYLGAIMRDHDIEMGPVGDIPGFEGTMDALDSLSIREEEEDVEAEIEDEVDVDVDDDMSMDVDSEADGIDVKQDADTDLGGTVGDVQDNLEAALEAARELGDEKLEDQIGNTLTFFTRTHVVKEEVSEGEVELEEGPDDDLELKSLAKKMIPIFKKYGMPVEYVTDKGEFELDKKPKDAEKALNWTPPARVMIDNGILNVAVYYMSLAKSVRQVNELDIDYNNPPGNGMEPVAAKQAQKMYRELEKLIGPEFEMQFKKDMDYKGDYVMRIRKKPSEDKMAAESLNEEFSRMQKIAGIKK